MESLASYVRMTQQCWGAGEGAQDRWNPQTPKSDLDARPCEQKDGGKVQEEGQDGVWQVELEEDIGSLRGCGSCYGDMRRPLCILCNERSRWNAGATFLGGNYWLEN